MKIYVWWDHYTLEIIWKIKKYLESKNVVFEYFGSESEEDKIDLHEFIKPVCEKVSWTDNYWILVCGTWAWVNIWANKFPWIRAVLCRKEIDAAWAREKDNANILCLSSWDTPDDALNIILKNFLETKFDNPWIMKSMDIMEKWK